MSRHCSINNEFLGVQIILINLEGFNFPFSITIEVEMKCCLSFQQGHGSQLEAKMRLAIIESQNEASYNGKENASLPKSLLLHL